MQISDKVASWKHFKLHLIGKCREYYRSKVPEFLINGSDVSAAMEYVLIFKYKLLQISPRNHIELKSFVSYACCYDPVFDQTGRKEKHSWFYRISEYRSMNMLFQRKCLISLTFTLVLWDNFIFYVLKSHKFWIQNIEQTTYIHRF